MELKGIATVIPMFAYFDFENDQNGGSPMPRLAVRKIPKKVQGLPAILNWKYTVQHTSK